MTSTCGQALWQNLKELGFYSKVNPKSQVRLAAQMQRAEHWNAKRADVTLSEGSEQARGALDWSLDHSTRNHVPASYTLGLTRIMS